MMESLPRSSEQRNLWSGHLQEILKSIGMEHAAHAEHWVESIAAYCEVHHPQGMQTNDLKLLMARASCALGDQETAGGVLSTMEPHRRYVTRWLEILSELDQFPELLPFFSQGVIRPADWTGAELDRMWMLDFFRMNLHEEGRHEMTVLRSLRALIAQMAPFWEATRGAGVLGLKGLASLQLEEDRSGETPLTTPDALMEYITEVFEQEKSQRDWESIPVLLKVE